MNLTTDRWLVALLSLLLATSIACGEDDVAEDDNQFNDDVRQVNQQEPVNDPQDNQNQNDQNQNNQDGPCEIGDCDGDLVCDTDSGECVECVEDDDCADRESCDDLANICIEDDPEGCLDDDDCPGSEVCNTDSEECVACLGDDDCPGDDLCRVDDHSCVPCLSDDDCADGVCDTTNDQCVDCLNDDDCATDEICDTTTNLCEDDDPAGCSSDIDCPGNDVCDTDSGDCLSCLDDGDCADGVCDADNDQCVDCLDDGDCADGVCDSDNDQCVDCLDDGDCADGVCDVDNDQCVDCLDDGDCPVGYDCETATNSCELDDPEACTDDDDCSDGVCDSDNDQCVECLDDGACADGVCDADNNQCVDCLDDGDCADGVCDADNDQCVGCLDDGDCADDEICDADTNVCEVDDTDITFGAESIPTDIVDDFSGAGFDFGLDDDGQPVVAILDYTDEYLYVARPDGTDWSVEIGADLFGHEFDSLSQVRLDIDDDGQAHIVVAGLYDLFYVYEETFGWTDQLIHTMGEGLLYSAAVAVGDDGAIHKMGGKSSGNDNGFYYERLADDGTTTVQRHELLYTDETVDDIDIDVRSNHEPMMLLTMNDDDTQILAPDDVEASSWDGGSIGAGTTDATRLAVDADDNPWAVFSPEGTDELESWRHDGGAWDDWSVETLSSSLAARPWFVLDDDHNPHVSYTDQDDYELTYGLRDDSTWTEHLVDDVLSLAESRIVADDAGNPHIVGMTGFDELQYFTVE